MEKVFLACALFKVQPNDMLTKLPDIKEADLDLKKPKNDISKKMKGVNAE